MPGAVYLEGDDVVLRTIEEDDLPILRDASNDPQVRRHLPNRPPLNLDGEREFYQEDVVGDDGAMNLLAWAADSDAETGERRAGTVGLHGLDSPDGSAEIGLFLVPDAWGEGVGTEAARLVTDWAFSAGRLHRVVARVMDGNEASAAFNEGGYVDQHLYAVLEHEWRADAD